MVPLEHSKWMALTWDCTLDHGCVQWASRPIMDYSGVRVFTVELLWTAFDKLLPLPTHPLSYASPKLVHTSKNDLKLPKIMQATNSKLYHINSSTK